MDEEKTNEVEVGQIIYVFASPGLAKAFETCLSTGTVTTCRLDHPPIAVYPPADKAAST
ncbi:hypothetical protein PQR63_15415 [Herbaspirillum rhizosphaerae]|uniref:Uncharacterized protein n=1 Tax=Herbaspirillum rhizosphaerae TaxID=346179 RepID=A0ABW8ZA65_9BURK